MTPLVNIITCTYNHEKYIAKTIEGVLMQKTNFDFVHIIGEDASTDNTRDIIENYSKKYPSKIKLINHKINVGAHENTKILFKEANAKYIALLDGDDYWIDPYKLQKQVDFLEANPDCVVCHHWQKYAVPKEDGSFEEISAPTQNMGYLPHEKATVKEIFANKLRVKTRTYLFRNVFNEFPKWFANAAYGDVAISMILGKYGKFGFIDEPMAVYRKTENGISSAGKGSYLQIYNHFLRWIEVWEYGIVHHDYQYYEEAKSTMLSFYHRILSNYPFDINIFFKLLFYAFIKSKLGFAKRMIIGCNLCKIYAKITAYKVLQFFKTRMPRVFFQKV